MLTKATLRVHFWTTLENLLAPHRLPRYECSDRCKMAINPQTQTDNKIDLLKVVPRLVYNYSRLNMRVCSPLVSEAGVLAETHEAVEIESSLWTSAVPKSMTSSEPNLSFMSFMRLSCTG